jgi:hypothetical protein
MPAAKRIFSPGRVIQYVEPSPLADGYPFDWQVAFHQSPVMFKGFSGPVGSGKSQALCYEALNLAYENPGRTGVIGAPTYPMLRDSTLTSFRELLEENEVPYRQHKSENTITITEPNSKILFRALDNFERIRGTNLAWFGIDELTYCKEESWLRLEARLRDRKAKRLCGFASWTPKGFDWVYERFIGPDKKLNHEAFRAEQNTALPADFYKRLESSYSERFFRQEALGEYLNVFSGQAYYPFKREVHVRPLTFDRRYPLWWALDFNVNPMCSVIGQTINGIVRVLDELVLPDSNTLAACEEFLERTQKWYGPLNIPELPEEDEDDEGQELLLRLARPSTMGVYVYGDPSGEARKTSASRTDWQIVKSFFGRYADKYQAHFRVPSSHGPVKDRINCVNAMLLNFAGQRRMVINTSCRELAKDFEQLAWKADPNGRPLGDLDKRDPMRSHLSDALGYYIVREFPMRGIQGEHGGPAIV